MKTLKVTASEILHVADKIINWDKSRTTNLIAIEQHFLVMDECAPKKDNSLALVHQATVLNMNELMKNATSNDDDSYVEEWVEIKDKAIRELASMDCISGEGLTEWLACKGVSFTPEITI